MIVWQVTTMRSLAAYSAVLLLLALALLGAPVNAQDPACLVSFQLLLGDVNNCSEWKFENNKEKISEIKLEIAITFQEQCSCIANDVDLKMENFLQADLTCPTADQSLVLFRAQIATPCDGSALSFLKDLVKSDSYYMIVLGEILAVFPDCPVEIESLLASTTCGAITQEEMALTEAPQNTTALRGAVSGVLSAIVVAVLLLFVAIYCCSRRLKKQSQNGNANTSYGIITAASLQFTGTPYYELHTTNKASLRESSYVTPSFTHQVAYQYDTPKHSSSSNTATDILSSTDRYQAPPPEMALTHAGIASSQQQKGTDDTMDKRDKGNTRDYNC